MTRDPELLIGEVALALVALVGLCRFIVRTGQNPRSPDPWDEEIEKAVHEPDAVEVCHRCFDPVPPAFWFCQHCGCAVGPYNNLMPYVTIFSEGEVLRNGANDKLRQKPLILAGYLLLSLHEYLIFAPIYWIFLFKNLNRQKASVEYPEAEI